MLLDHHGRVIAVHVKPNSGQWVPAMMMSIIRARFQPARLNGAPIPCLIIISADTELEMAQ